MARVIAFVEMNDLNPKGKIRLPVVASMISERYGFAKSPAKPEDFDEVKGVEFEEGAFEDIGIDKLTIWSNGVGIDVRSSTDDARAILEKALEWLRKEVGLNYDAGTIKRWAYLSQVTFFSNADFDNLHPALMNLGRELTIAVSRLYGLDFEFRSNILGWSFDRTLKQFPISDFSIQRRVETPFSEGKYFSQAPLSTSEHLNLLEQFEANILKK